MSSLLRALGVDPSDFEWQDIASCSRTDEPDFFFDDYESDRVIAENVDRLCLSCPVADQCFTYGVETKAWGVWGGIYLVKGTIDSHRNSHKTEETWEKIGRLHGV